MKSTMQSWIPSDVNTPYFLHIYQAILLPI